MDDLYGLLGELLGPSLLPCTLFYRLLPNTKPPGVLLKPKPPGLNVVYLLNNNLFGLDGVFPFGLALNNPGVLTDPLRV